MPRISYGRVEPQKKLVQEFYIISEVDICSVIRMKEKEVERGYIREVG